MKSNLEWVAKIFEAGNHLSDEHFKQELSILVKQIQLDAYKQGLEEARQVALIFDDKPVIIESIQHTINTKTIEDL